MKWIGASFGTYKSRFSVWAPDKSQVELAVEGGSSSIYYPLVKSEEGYWETEITLPAGSLYRYRIDGQQSFPDPASRLQPDGVHGPSALTDPHSFAWSDEKWTGLEMNDMVIYELHTGAFSASHDFNGVRQKFNYLKELGINTIELMPVAAFPGVRNWGYDGVYPFAVQLSYGGPEELKSLVNEAHQNGFAVILDVVYNHLGPDGNYLAEFGPYFSDKYKSGWGSALNFDDRYSDGVRNFFIANAMMWLDEFHIDGLRLDAVHAIVDHSARHLMAEISDHVDILRKSRGVKKWLIAEIDLNDTRYIQKKELGGYGLDGQWVDEFHHAVHSLLTGETSGYYEDFGKTSDLVKAINNSYVYDGNYSVHRKRTFGSDARAFSADHFVVFIQNHDQTGNRLNGERLGHLVPPDALKVAAGVMLLSPYVPMLFMGEEYGEENPFQFFIDHTDPVLIENTRKGRKQEFAYFKLQGEFPDPATEETFEKSGLTWHTDRKKSAELFNWYKWLILFRKTHPAMKGKARNAFRAYSPAERLIVLDRNHDTNRLKIIFNFSSKPQALRLDLKDKHKLLMDSRNPSPGDPGAALYHEEAFFIQPFTLRIYELS